MKIWSLIPLLILAGCSNDVKFDTKPATDNFAQDVKYNKKVDILFIVDNSQSMNLVQKQLIDQIPYLFDSLQNLNMDIHVASTSTTMNSHFANVGKLIGDPKFISNETPGFLDEIKKRILIGDNGSSIEEGLSSMAAVLSDSYLATEGKGFLRDDSFLNIIVLSNEDDSSPDSWTTYTEFLDKLRPNRDDGSKAWALNFFGVLSMDDQCSSSDWGYKYPGYKYMKVVDYSGGFKGSLCGSDLYRSVSTIKAKIIQILTDYKLNAPPIIDSIHVFVANIEVPKNDVNGWSYIAEKNSVRFNGNSVPKPDQGIRVDFKPAESN